MIRNAPLLCLVACLALPVAAAPATAAGAKPAAGAPASAAQKGRVVRATDLRDKPDSTGKLLEVVPANTEVSVVERQGGWYKVALPSRDGWVRLTAVRFATATPAASGGLTSSLAFLKSGRSAVQTGTVTTGVRGLSETDLQNSVPAPEAVDALDALVVAPDDARQHAKSLGLKPVEVEFIKPPEPDKESKKKKGKDDEEDGG